MDDGWQADAFDEGAYDYSELEAVTFAGLTSVHDVEKEEADGQWLASTVEGGELELSDQRGSAVVDAALRNRVTKWTDGPLGTTSRQGIVVLDWRRRRMRAAW